MNRMDGGTVNKTGNLFFHIFFSEGHSYLFLIYYYYGVIQDVLLLNDITKNHMEHTHVRLVLIESCLLNFRGSRRRRTLLVLMSQRSTIPENYSTTVARSVQDCFYLKINFSFIIGTPLARTKNIYAYTLK